jgi:predicted ester cyclase
MNETCDIPRASDFAGRAKAALERVCSGADLDPASRFYDPSFVDHVNDLEFHGLDGAHASVDLYKSVLSNLKVQVEEQVVDGERVTSRFIVSGTSHGRYVRFGGITISRFADGMIVEDWSVIDTLSLVRQLGVWRAVLVGAKQWRLLARSR